jgi:hypothetical protein
VAIQIENTGFRVKPGMTIKGKRHLTQYSIKFLDEKSIGKGIKGRLKED